MGLLRFAYKFTGSVGIISKRPPKPLRMKVRLSPAIWWRKPAALPQRQVGLCDRGMVDPLGIVNSVWAGAGG